MALLDFFLGIQDPVEGSYRVTRATKAITSSSVGRCDLMGELTSPGRPPRMLDHHSPLTSIDKWPRVGDILPVVFDRTNSEFMRITWKDVPPHPTE